MNFKAMLVPNFPSYQNSNLVPKYIIIHNTAGMSSAYEEAKRVQNPNAYNNGITHYYVDENESYQVLLENIKCYGSGDGANGRGNGQSLQIEVCRSLPGGNFANENDKERFLKAENNAIYLANELMKRHGIPVENILLHKELSATACPYTSELVHGNSKQYFIDKINELRNPKPQITTPKSGDVVFQWLKVVNDFTKNAYSTSNSLYEMECIADTQVYKDVNCTIKDVAIFKKGEKVLTKPAKVINWNNGKNVLRVHSFASGGKEFYVAYQEQVK